MVDPVSGSGNIQNIQSNRAQNADNNQRRENVRESREASPRDEVSLSEEALDIVRAQEVAQQARLQLEESDVSLGLDPNFDEEV